MLEKWTNTSSPCSREMKPNPFSALKNLTVPVTNSLSHSLRACRIDARRRHRTPRRSHHRRDRYGGTPPAVEGWHLPPPPLARVKGHRGKTEEGGAGRGRRRSRPPLPRGDRQPPA